jgi:hypothetical protein
LLIWMLLFGFYNFGHSSKTVVSNGSIFSISKVSCNFVIFIENHISDCHTLTMNIFLVRNAHHMTVE